MRSSASSRPWAPPSRPPRRDSGSSWSPACPAGRAKCAPQDARTYREPAVIRLRLPPGRHGGLLHPGPGRLRPVPDTLDDQTAALIEPLSTPVHAVRLAGDVAGRAVAFWGRDDWVVHPRGAPGARGRESGQHRPEAPGARAAALGAHATIDARTPDVAGQVRRALGGSADIVFDCVAIQSSIDQAIAMADKAGRSWWAASRHGRSPSRCRSSRPTDPHSGQCHVSPGGLPRIGRPAGPGYRPDRGLRHRHRPLAQVAEALGLASSGSHVKVLLTVGQR